MKIVIPDHIELTTNHTNLLKTLPNSTVYTDKPQPETIVERIKDAELITANWIDITREIINQAPKLRYIVVPAVGYEWIDVQTATAKGIKVLNCPKQNSAAVANMTMTLILAVTRRIIEANNDLKNGIWNPSGYTGVELSGKTLGLLGYGNIGKNVEKLAQGLGLEVIHTNSQSTAEEIDRMLQVSDIISLHAPLTDKTKGIIDERRLGLMKKGAYFINTARGAEVDENALYSALQSGHLAGAGLDVFQNETFGNTTPDSIKKLALLPNVVATPHMAFDTDATQERLGEELLANIQACLDEKPINVVN